MLIGEIIQRIQSLYSRGVASDDSRLASRHIYNKLLSVRAFLLAQIVNKKQMINMWNYQVLPCVELIKTERHECPCLPPIGCSILKTKFELPRPLSSMDNHMIKSVTSIDGSINYSETTWEAVKYKFSNKYTASKPEYYIRDKFLFITHKGGPKVISIEGLFEDPQEAAAYPNYCGDDTAIDCKPIYDLEFPFETSKLDALIELCSNELISLFSKNIEDKTNNNSDSVKEKSK